MVPFDSIDLLQINTTFLKRSCPNFESYFDPGFNNELLKFVLLLHALFLWSKPSGFMFFLDKELFGINRGLEVD